MILEPIHVEADISRYLQASVNPVLMDGLFELTKLRTAGSTQDPILWLANYLMKHNPFKPVVGSASPESLAKIAEIERKMKEFELERDIEEVEDDQTETSVTCDDDSKIETFDE